MSKLFKLLVVWWAVHPLFTLLTGFQTPITSALSMMLFGSTILWIFLCGGIMFKFRDMIKKIVLKVGFGWKLKFVLFATVLALIEEAIATIMNNNMAPAFGIPMGNYLTATTNYFELVMFHSVIVFIPMFIAWAFLLSRYDFKPDKVFLMFGFSGLLAEATLDPSLYTLGIAGGFWMFVYGLMVYLPAYTLPDNRKVKPVRLWHYVLALVVPLILAIPVALVMSIISQALSI